MTILMIAKFLFSFNPEKKSPLLVLLDSKRLEISPKNGWRANYFISQTGGPNGIRTRVTGVRGQCPGPLDDGTKKRHRFVYNVAR